MRWQAVTYYQPYFSQQKRLMLAAGIVCIAGLRCLVEFFENGFSNQFYLYGGFALLASVWEWRHFSKPREISLTLEEGRLVYKNHYTGEQHTVYQSRTHWIKDERDELFFYGESSIATRIPLRYFSEEQMLALREAIHTWDKKMVQYGK